MRRWRRFRENTGWLVAVISAIVAVAAYLWPRPIIGAPSQIDELRTEVARILERLSSSSTAPSEISPSSAEPAPIQANLPTYQGNGIAQRSDDANTSEPRPTQADPTGESPRATPDLAVRAGAAALPTEKAISTSSIPPELSLSHAYTTSASFIPTSFRLVLKVTGRSGGIVRTVQFLGMTLVDWRLDFERGGRCNPKFGTARYKDGSRLRSLPFAGDNGDLSIVAGQTVEIEVEFECGYVGDPPDLRQAEAQVGIRWQPIGGSDFEKIEVAGPVDIRPLTSRGRIVAPRRSTGQ